MISTIGGIFNLNHFDQSSRANDVIVIRHMDGSLHSSPFNVRFGRAAIWNSINKVVQVEVNGVLTNAVMKIGKGGVVYWLEPTYSHLNASRHHRECLNVKNPGVLDEHRRVESKPKRVSIGQVEVVTAKSSVADCDSATPGEETGAAGGVAHEQDRHNEATTSSSLVPFTEEESQLCTPSPLLCERSDGSIEVDCRAIHNVGDAQRTKIALQAVAAAEKSRRRLSMLFLTKDPFLLESARQEDKRVGLWGGAPSFRPATANSISKENNGAGGAVWGEDEEPVDSHFRVDSKAELLMQSSFTMKGSPLLSTSHSPGVASEDNALAVPTERDAVSFSASDMPTSSFVQFEVPACTASPALQGCENAPERGDAGMTVSARSAFSGEDGKPEKTREGGVNSNSTPVEDFTPLEGGDHIKCSDTNAALNNSTSFRSDGSDSALLYHNQESDAYFLDPMDINDFDELRDELPWNWSFSSNVTSGVSAPDFVPFTESNASYNMPAQSLRFAEPISEERATVSPTKMASGRDATTAVASDRRDARTSYKPSVTPAVPGEASLSPNVLPHASDTLMATTVASRNGTASSAKNILVSPPLSVAMLCESPGEGTVTAAEIAAEKTNAMVSIPIYQPSPDAKGTHHAQERGSCSNSQNHDTTSYFVRSLIPSQEDLKKLNLLKGPNQVRYLTRKNFNDEAVSVMCNIFLWDYTDKLVVSDVDGTITKSDLWGHFYQAIGKGGNWTHPGICSLYTKIVANGYKMVYLSARSVTQINQTKRYLWTLEQEGVRLPLGPVLTAPQPFFTALTKEVSKQSHLFKIACLTSVRAAFPLHTKPFFAGFGNRYNDVISYNAVDIPPHRIFIIDPSSVLHVSQVKQTYRNLTHLVDVTFPRLYHRNQHCGSYTDSAKKDEPLSIHSAGAASEHESGAPRHFHDSEAPSCLSASDAPFFAETSADELISTGNSGHGGAGHHDTSKSLASVPLNDPEGNRFTSPVSGLGLFPHASSPSPRASALLRGNSTGATSDGCLSCAKSSPHATARDRGGTLPRCGSADAADAHSILSSSQWGINTNTILSPGEYVAVDPDFSSFNYWRIDPLDLIVSSQASPTRVAQGGSQFNRAKATVSTPTTTSLRKQALHENAAVNAFEAKDTPEAPHVEHAALPLEVTSEPKLQLPASAITPSAAAGDPSSATRLPMNHQQRPSSALLADANERACTKKGGFFSFSFVRRTNNVVNQNPQDKTARSTPAKGVQHPDSLDYY